jgi:hypothetical protein
MQYFQLLKIIELSTVGTTRNHNFSSLCIQISGAALSRAAGNASWERLRSGVQGQVGICARSAIFLRSVRTAAVTMEQ